MEINRTRPIMVVQGLLQPLVPYGHCSFSCSQRSSRNANWSNGVSQQQIRCLHPSFQRARRSCAVRAEDKGTTEVCTYCLLIVKNVIYHLLQL